MVVGYYLVLYWGCKRHKATRHAPIIAGLAVIIADLCFCAQLFCEKDIFLYALGVENSLIGVELLGGATAWAIPLFTTPD